MAYDVHIVRTEDWLDAAGDPITREEVDALIAADSELAWSSADRAYDSEPHRQELRGRGIEPKLAKRRTPHGSGLGKYRWVVERTISWFHRARKLRLRTDWRDDIHEALMSLGSSLICWNILVHSLC